MSESEFGSNQDPMRLCPTCRCPISVLATRCRHCGESVGRPRKEEHKLTVHDLGGETKANYVISGNVMDALEAFRAEELSAQEVAKQDKMRSSWFGKKDTPTPGRLQTSELPDLDDEHRELSSFSSPSRSQSSMHKRAAQQGPPAITRTAFTIAAVMAGLVLLYLGTDYSWAKINDYLESRRTAGQIDYTSKALAMLEAGEPITAVYDEAVTALQTTDKEENREALQQVRETLLERVEAILNAPTLDRNAMNEASRWMAKAGSLDTDARVQEVAERVRDDIFAYNMVLSDISTEEGRPVATFTLNNPRINKVTETVPEGGMLQGRFIVKDIGERIVQLEDTQVKTPSGLNRKLVARPTTELSSQ